MLCVQSRRISPLDEWRKRKKNARKRRNNERFHLFEVSVFFFCRFRRTRNVHRRHGRSKRGTETQFGCRSMRTAVCNYFFSFARRSFLSKWVGHFSFRRFFLFGTDRRHDEQYDKSKCWRQNDFIWHKAHAEKVNLSVEQICFCLKICIWTRFVLIRCANTNVHNNNNLFVENAIKRVSRFVSLFLLVSYFFCLSFMQEISLEKKNNSICHWRTAFETNE